jgi:hypothetical protein
MIIPIGTSDKYNIGDIVVLLSDYGNKYVQTTKGHEFEYAGKDDDGHILKDGDVILHIYNKSIFTLKISYDQAVTEVNDRDDSFYYRDFIRSVCPHKTLGYEARETYDVCDLLEPIQHNDSCIPSSSCSKYVELDKLDNRCLKYLRKIKLKELKSKNPPLEIKDSE